jgi:hypothetical protein
VKDEVDKILCITQLLFDLMHKKNNFNKGLYRRFNINCYGRQLMMTDIRGQKTEKFNELKHYKFNSTPKDYEKYEEWFLNYKPGLLKQNINLSNKNKTTKKIHYTSKKHHKTTKKHHKIIKKNKKYYKKTKKYYKKARKLKTLKK